MFPISLVACLFQVLRLPIHKNKFEINWRGDMITVITVPKVSRGVSFFPSVFFFLKLSPWNISYTTMYHFYVPYTVQASSERFMLTVRAVVHELLRFFDGLDIVKNKLNLLNESFRNYRSGCEMPHLLSEATVWCWQSCLWVAGKEEKKSKK